MLLTPDFIIFMLMALVFSLIILPTCLAATWFVFELFGSLKSRIKAAPAQPSLA